jgi:hypothetical protein
MNSLVTQKYFLPAVLTALLITHFFILNISRAGETPAGEIMNTVYSRDDGNNMISEMEMILIDKKGGERVRKMRMYKKDKGVDTLKILTFLAPEEVKGVSFLAFDYLDVNKVDDMWLYMPELGETLRIDSTDTSSPFMGSDFSYADLTKKVAADWKHKLLREETIDGKKMWVIEEKPINKEVEGYHGYTKSINYVSQDNFVIYRAIRWLKRGKRVKYFEAKQVEQIDGIWTKTLIHGKMTKNNRVIHQSIFRHLDVKYNQNLVEEMFTVEQLEKKDFMDLK